MCRLQRRRGARLVPQPKHTSRFTDTAGTLQQPRAVKLNHRRTPYQVVERQSPSATPLRLLRTGAQPQDTAKSPGDNREDEYEPHLLDALEI